ncbi:hypothetical protein GCM10009610_47990 [Pseudonocardia xinjiangensis]
MQGVGEQFVESGVARVERPGHTLLTGRSPTIGHGGHPIDLHEGNRLSLNTFRLYS